MSTRTFDPVARRRTPRPAVQRGLGALAIVMVMVMASSLAMLYLNRGLLFEQRTAINQAQALVAQEMAEAGIEWAVGMLNAPYDIGADCAFLTTTNVSFRKRYVLTRFADASSPTTDVVPAATTYPGCKAVGGALTCSCPAPSGSVQAVAALGSTEAPSFTVAFDAVAGEPEAVQVTSYGCNAQAAACAPATAAASEGHARITAVLKLRPLLRAVPAAPLTCGTSCTVGGSFNLVNQDVGANGILVNAGAAISTGNGVSLTSLPGQPTATALVGNDVSLSSLSSADPTCSGSRMFSAYMGSTLAQYRAAPTTKSLSCSSTADCASALSGAYADGWRSFYFTSDLQLSGSATYGTRADPITIVSERAIKVNGNNEFWGLIFSNNSDWNNIGTGSAVIHGAEVVCAAYNNNGNGTLAYDADVLRNARRLTGLMVRVPGSWRDFKLAGDTRP